MSYARSLRYNMYVVSRLSLKGKIEDTNNKKI